MEHYHTITSQQYQYTQSISKKLLQRPIQIVALGYTSLIILLDKITNEYQIHKKSSTLFKNMYLSTLFHQLRDPLSWVFLCIAKFDAVHVKSRAQIKTGHLYIVNFTLNCKKCKKCQRGQNCKNCKSILL